MRTLAAVCLLMTACSGGSGGKPDASVVTPADEYCAAFARSSCERQAACGLVSEAGMKACHMAELRTCELDLGRFVRGGAVAVKADAAAACAARLEALSCPRVAQVDARTVCLHDPAIRTPNAKLGERCSTTADCVQGHCELESALGCGVCTPYPEAGGACGVCDPASMRCEGQADAGTGTCTPLLPDGDPCEESSVCASSICNAGGTCGRAPRGGSCSNSSECEDADYCYSNTCTARKVAGENCSGFRYSDAWSGCRKDLRCVEGACAAIAPHSLAESSICSSNEDCASELCQSLTPTRAGTCAAVLPEGASCDGYSYLCSEGLVCAYRPDSDGAVYPQCAPPYEEGASCPAYYNSAGSACMTGLRCPSWGHGAETCMPLGSAGDVCMVDDDCASRRCKVKCFVPGGLGDACKTDHDCVDRCVVARGESDGVCSTACFPAAL